MKFHKLAKLFPLLDEVELRALADDIKKNGLIEPIWTFEDQILDGRNRFNACEAIGVKPKFQEYKGSDPVAFVIAINILRRHLSPWQLAILASEPALIEHYREQAKERETLGKAKLPDPSMAGQVRDQAGAAVGVSGKYVEYAMKIRELAPELVEPSKAGKLDAITAVALADAPSGLRNRTLERLMENKISIKEARAALQPAKAAAAPGPKQQLLDQVMSALDGLDEAVNALVKSSLPETTKREYGRLTFEKISIILTRLKKVYDYSDDVR